MFLRVYATLHACIACFISVFFVCCFFRHNKR